jgi:hypothetical protein
VFENVEEKGFKHHCGEYPTASSFALGMLLHFNVSSDNSKRIVLINHFKHYYACWLIETV